jgi:CelD/BcsL family acetyltransferase involved in cellulose biosynthesis
MMTWHIYPITDFKDYQEKWDNLNRQNANTPLLSSHFVAPLLKYFAKGNEKLAIHGNPEQPDAMTILTKTKLAIWETLQPSQAPLGLWIQDKKIPTANLLSELRKKLPFPTLLVGVTQQDPDLLPRPENQKCLSTLDYIQTARVSVKDSFADYWGQRGKNLRQNLNRQRNRLQREDVNTALKIITATEDIEPAIIEYGNLESVGWKSAGGTAIHIDNIQGQFYRDMLINFSLKQNALIFQYFYADNLVATDLCIKDKKSLIILKTTFDETITTSSPAMLMRQDAFQYIFNEKLIERIEFYGKVMDWHTKWSDEIRSLFHINQRIFL